MRMNLARTPLQMGAALRRRRKELGLSQAAAAGSIARRQATLSDLENGGDVRLSTLLRLLATLDLELVVRPRTHGDAAAEDALGAIAEPGEIRTTGTGK
jgi:HTH-type transcriptional regulator / antitoxin HipB